MIFFPDQMHPVGFDIIGLKISLSEAVRHVRLIWAGGSGRGGGMRVEAFCLYFAILPAWNPDLSCVPTVCSAQRMSLCCHYTEMVCAYDRVTLWGRTDSALGMHQGMHARPHPGMNQGACPMNVHPGEHNRTF